MIYDYLNVYIYKKGIIAMKIIFLDIDGVLNSFKYDSERKPEDGNIDATRLPLLKRLVDYTGAKIVLTSTWRKFWERDQESIIYEAGKEINRIFASAGLEIFDKTPVLGRRKDEIFAWIKQNKEVEVFCIIDDICFGWDELAPFLVNTNPRIGRGLEEKHIEKSISILTDL